MQCNTCFIVEYTMCVGSRAISGFAAFPSGGGALFLFYYFLKIILLFLQINGSSKIRCNCRFLLHQKSMQCHLNYAVAVVIPSFFKKLVIVLLFLVLLLLQGKEQMEYYQRKSGVFIYLVFYEICVNLRGKIDFVETPSSPLLFNHPFKKK